MRAVTATLVLACAGCGSTNEVPPDAAPTPSRGTEVAATPHFAFHSNLLLNLHHFVYQCAAAAARRDGETVSGRPVDVAEIDAVDALAGEERDAWLTALAFYRRDAVARDLVFDGTMYALKRRLVQIDDADGDWHWPDDLDTSYQHALRAALPVYRTHFWNAHDAANRAWIAAAVAELARYEAALVERMIAAYGGSWPPAPVRVDVCAYASWAGAYTTGGPAHVTQSSTSPDAQGHAALESLVHEVSHTREMFDPLRDALAAAYAARGTKPPRDLWHLLIFATAGEAVRRTLAADGIDGYVHYGVRTGLYRRGAWEAQWPLLEEPWSAFLGGEIDRATALQQIAARIDG